MPAKQHFQYWPQFARTAKSLQIGVHTRGFSTDFQHVKLGFVPLPSFRLIETFKSNTRNGRLKLVEITSLGRSEFKFTHAVDTNAQV